MTTRFRPSRPVRFAAVTAAALGLGVPAALALTDAPERPRLEPVVRSVSSDDDAPEVEDEVTTTNAAGVVDEVEADDNEDVRGPCDEAEHADDPGCAGVTPTTPAVDDDHDDDAVEADENEDVSGPCDEAEHADDPRCTGTTTPTSTSTTVDDDRHDDRDDGDHSGSSHDDTDDDDRSGSNSGPG